MPARTRVKIPAVVVCAIALSVARPVAQPASQPSDVSRVVAAILGDTPLVRDLRELADTIGGRPTGSEANLRSVEWSLGKFKEAGVSARREAFTMPAKWLERSASATISGAGVSFSPRVAAMPFSGGTPAAGISASLVDAGAGTDADFARLGAMARGAFLLVETHELRNVDDLFKEYVEAGAIEARAEAAGAAGIVYQGSRPTNTLYRHNVSVGPANTRPMIVMERDAAQRALRLLRSGVALTITERLDIDAGGPYESYNVIAEIRGATRPDEVVVMGAHLDSWDMGTGTLDNGANVAMMIDIARQLSRLGIKPVRTIRLALWNGEEQGIYGSLGYTRTHASELDRHVMAGSIDIGCGRITGFFTGGRAEIVPAVDRALEAVAGLGPFTQVNVPIVGTDNLDFMLEGVANIVANQEPALYGPNYHARSDEFDKCDTGQLRLNEAIVAAAVLGIANGEVTWRRQTPAEFDTLVKTTDLEQQMRTLMSLWNEWQGGARGRRR